jgi:ribosomal protein S6--L-glutamate ligase
MVLEVNSSPGFEGLEEATGLDIAGAIVERAKEIARLS